MERPEIFHQGPRNGGLDPDCLEMQPPFSVVDDKIKSYWDNINNNDIEQSKRRRRAALTTPITIDRAKQKGIFRGSHGEMYFVSLTNCACYDYSKRRRPCKHIYRLTSEIGILKQLLEVSKNNRNAGIASQDIEESKWESMGIIDFAKSENWPKESTLIREQITRTMDFLSIIQKQNKKGADNTFEMFRKSRFYDKSDIPQIQKPKCFLISYAELHEKRSIWREYFKLGYSNIFKYIEFVDRNLETSDREWLECNIGYPWGITKLEEQVASQEDRDKEEYIKLHPIRNSIKTLYYAAACLVFLFWIIGISSRGESRKPYHRNQNSRNSVQIKSIAK